MHMSILLLLLAMTLAVFCLGLRGTVYEFSLRRRNLGGALIGIELFIFVIPGVFFFETLGIGAFHTFYMTEASIRFTSIVVLWSLLVLLVFLTAFSRLLFSRYLTTNRNCDCPANHKGSLRALLDVALLLLICTTAAFQAMGLHNAFVESIVFGKDLLSVRLANRYGASVPTVAMSYFTFLTALSSIALGLLYADLSRIGRWARLIIILYAVSMSGQKAPIVYMVILVVLAALSGSQRISFARAAGLAVAGLVVLTAVLFVVAIIQFPGLDIYGFGSFLMERLAVGQIHGAYEQFALKLHDPDYIWHAVPFANILLDYKIFNKDLMMHTWGLGSAAEDIGVMNSLFIGEAYAIGGFPLVLLSPVIVAFNYCVLSLSLLAVLRATGGLGNHQARKVVTLLVPGIAFFTGDIAGLLMFKLNVMAVCFLLTVVALTSVLRAATAHAVRREKIVPGPIST